MYILILPTNNVKNTQDNEPKRVDDDDDDEVKKRVSLFLEDPFLIAIVENQENRKTQTTQTTIT